MATRIALIHSHFLVRTGLKCLIAGQDDLILSGIAETIEQANEIPGDNVDVLVFNLQDPETGYSQLQLYKKLFPKAKFLSVSYMPSRREVAMGIEAGVQSFLLTECEMEEILEAVQATRKGEQFFCGLLLSQVIQSPDEVVPSSEFTCGGVKISTREAEIIRMVAEGLTNKEIADRLCISTHTVTTHRKNIMAKLGVNNTAGLVMFAIKNGIVTPNHFLFSTN